MTKLRLVKNDELDADEVEAILTTEYVDRVEYDDKLERFALILDTGRVVTFGARADGCVANLYEVVE
jgi:hypothetical protein